MKLIKDKIFKNIEATDRNKNDIFKEAHQNLVNCKFLKDGSDVEALVLVFNKIWENGYNWGNYYKQETLGEEN